MEPEPKIETVTVPLHPDLVNAMERMQARVDALPLFLTEEGRAQIDAAERRFERRVLGFTEG